MENSQHIPANHKLDSKSFNVVVYGELNTFAIKAHMYWKKMIDLQSIGID